jgi:Xaa-Pro aminopeptidase
LDAQHPLLYGYASFVDRTTGMIGDFGVTLYFGKKPAIKNHLRQCLLLNKEIFDFIEVGKSFAEVYEFAHARFGYYGLTNHVISNTDPAGMNIGHTVPASDTDWTPEEVLLLRAGDEVWDEVKNMISKRRKFVSPLEQIIYQPGMAVTLEPRLVAIDDPSIPMV